VIEVLLLAGLIALGLLLAVAVLYVLHQRRQGTVRAVFRPRRGADRTPDGAAKG
jgi:hypothetical protein